MSKISVIEPSVRVIKPNQDPVEKVATMARLCYRSEANRTPATDADLIKKCIQNGHTSVLEHNYMSVYFGDSPITMKTMQIPQFPNGYTTAQLWASFMSPDIRKYTEVYGDDEIYKVIDGGNAPYKVYPVVVGNFRAWLNILESCITASIRDHFPIGVAMIGGILVKANKLFPAIFGSLVNDVNDALKSATRDNYLFKTFMPADAPNGAVMTIENLSRFYNMMEITCAQTTPRYSLSVILRTDRAVTHQLVRHRRDIAYSQESQRYVNYQNKGYEVVCPQMDPVRYKDMMFASVPVIKDGATEATIEQLHLLPDGYLPPNSSAYNTWRAAMELAVDHYELLRNTEMVEHVTDGKDPGVLPLPPEVARSVLPNSFATTIGVTWTPATFVNVLKWRLDDHAQWPIRYLIGTVVVECLRMQHAFFENFPPDLVKSWIGKCYRYQIIKSEEEFKELVAYQEKRQANIDAAKKAMIEQYEAAHKAQQEAAKKAAAAKGNTPETPAEKPAEPTPSAPTPTNDSTKQ